MDFRECRKCNDNIYKGLVIHVTDEILRGRSCFWHALFSKCLLGNAMSPTCQWEMPCPRRVSEKCRVPDVSVGNAVPPTCHWEMPCPRRVTGKFHKVSFSVLLFHTVKLAFYSILYFRSPRLLVPSSSESRIQRPHFGTAFDIKGEGTRFMCLTVDPP
jgi:hypothetical protein